jgi:hypothetical protein
MDNTQFRCIVSNSAGSATSKEATLTVKGGAAPPVIAKQPSPATATPGGSVTFSVSVESDEKLTYQWQVLAPRSLLGWQNVVNSGLMTPKGSIYYAGATTDQLSISDIPATQNGAQYRCMITGPGGSITSNPVTLTVQAAAVDPPVITTQPPAKVALKEGGTTKLSVTANGNGQPLQYQWEIRNPSWGDGFYDVGDEDGRYSGINTAMLTISNTPSYFDGYQYRCRVTAGNLIDVPVYSNTVTLAVEEYIFEFTLQPSDRTVKEGGNTTFSVAVTVGQVPLQYQWYYITYYYYDYGYGYGGDYYPTYSLIENDGIFSDAQTATLKLTGAPARMDGYEFVCGVSVPNYWEGGMLSEYMSDQAMLSVEAIGPGIISHPADRRIPEGGNTTFSVTTVSSLPSTTCEVELLYEYQWQYRLPKSADDDFNDVEDGEIYSGTSTSTLTLNNVPISYSGYQYRCKVFTISCSEFYDESNSATLTVDAPSNNVPSILTHPDDQSIRQGANASFSVTTAHAGKFSYLYQWQYRVNANSNFINVPNSGIYSDAQMATLKLTDVPLAYHNYQYRCRVYLPEWNEWTEFSNHATLEVTPADAPPKITTTSVPAAEVKKPYNITLRATGTTPITWSITAGRLPNGLSLNSGSGVISGTPTVAGPLQFTVRAANRIGNDTRAFTIAVNETPQQPPVIEITSPSAPFCTANDYLRVPFKKIENEHPMKYSLRYNDEAKAVGFKDTSFENLPADMVFKIDVPAGVPSKSYSATVVITCERLDEYMNEYPFTFSVTNNGVVIVNQPPAFQSICGGASIALTVDIAGNASNYQWYINGQAIAGAVNKDYIADKEGIYYVEVRGSCGVVRSAEAVVASPASAPGSVSIQTKWGNVLYVENSADKYNRFQWYRDGSAISGATFVYFSEKEGFLGEYYVRCFKPDGAFDDTCPIVFTTRSIVSTASVYPTRLKANDVLNVEIKEANTAINARVEIYSVLGLKVYSTRINMPVTTIRPTGMNRGNYFVKIRLSSGEIINEKIVVQ